jgi:hypothetical protein
MNTVVDTNTVVYTFTGTCPAYMADYVAEFCNSADEEIVVDAAIDSKSITFQTNMDWTFVRDIANGFNAAEDESFVDIAAVLEGREDIYKPGVRNYICTATWNGQAVPIS